MQIDNTNGELEATGGSTKAADVLEEEQRVRAQLSGPRESRDAVIIEDINKVLKAVEAHLSIHNV